MLRCVAIESLGSCAAGLLCCRIAGLPGCWAAVLQGSVTASVPLGLQGLLSWCFAVGLLSALQGHCTTALLHCRSGVQQRSRACGANDTPAQAKEREVNANVNSIILKSLPKFGKLFKNIEFTSAFTSLFFACAGVSFTPCLPCCTPDRQ